jgi:hypothetical protein
MNNTAACSHPLDIAGSDDPFVAHTVSMLNISAEHIGDSFNSSVWVPGKSFDVIFWFLGPKNRPASRKDQTEGAH